MPSIKSNDITIEYESFGSAKAPAIVLIMGLGMQLTAWPDPFCDALVKQDFRVIRFDNRDIGLSSKLAHLGTPNLAWASLKHLIGLPLRNPYLLTDMAADTVGLLDGLELQRAHIVGVSMGGMIAQLVAALYRDRTLSLTSIMSSSGDPRLPGPSRAVERALLSRPEKPREFESVVDHYVKFFRLIASPGFPTDPVELRERLEKNVRRSNYPAGTARQILAIAASGDRSHLLPTIVAPTLVIHGDKDPLVPLAAGQDTAKKIPGARMKIIEGMGHDMAAWPLLAEEIAGHCRQQRSPD
jgi:proline iminopeptidase